MTKLKKIKNQSIFWIAVFSILVQVFGQTETKNTATSSLSSCGGVLELSSGTLDFSPVGQNQNQNGQDFCIWVIKLPVPSETIKFQLTQIPQSSQLNLYSQEGHVAGQISVLPLASLTTADVKRSVNTNSSNLVVVWTPSRVEKEGDDSSGLLSFTWDEDESSAQGQRSGQVAGIKNVYLNLIGGVNYVEADRGRFSWAKPGKRQQTLLWVLNSKSSEPLDLKIETGLEDCDLSDPCLCSYFGVYEIRDNFLRAVSTECGRSSNLQYSGIRPRLVAFGFVNPEFQRDTNHVTLSWNDQEPEEGTTATTTTSTTDITTEITTTEEQAPTAETTETTDFTTDNPTTEEQASTTEEEEYSTGEEQLSTMESTKPPKICPSAIEYPKSCSDFEYDSGSGSGSTGNSSQLERCLIYPNGAAGGSLQVLCDFGLDGGGWTIFQKRSSGPSNDFDRTWAEYETGFGSLDGNFWLGLKNIQALTDNYDQELRMDMEDFEGNKKWAKYSKFYLWDSSYRYQLNIYEFSGNVYDSFTRHNQNKFGTKDRYTEVGNGNCGAASLSGWWFGEGCYRVNLNGLYPTGTRWSSWSPPSDGPLAKTLMQIRTKNMKHK